MSIVGQGGPVGGSRVRPRLWIVAAVAVAAVASILTFTAGNAAASEVTPIEFSSVDAPADVAPVIDDSVAGANRARFVAVDTDDLLGALGAADVTIELFDDVVVPFGSSGVLATSAASGPNGVQLTWSATTAEAIATLSLADDGVRGTISAGAKTYSIMPASGSTHLIFEDGRSLPNETEPLPPPTDATNFLDDAGDLSSSTSTVGADAALDVDPVAASDGTPVIRVLTVYDDSSRTYLGGDAATVAWLSATIDEVNAAYARSGVNTVMQSAAIEHVDYVGAGTSANTELNRITGTTDGYLDAVHARRDALAADLVVFVVPLESSTCGQAWLLTPPVNAGDAAFGFAVVRPDCARANLTFAHETGHNLGAGHGPPESPGVVPHANGYRNEAAGYRTIMAYQTGSCASPCTRVPYFSSPTVLYNGQPTGSPTQDNARVLTEFAPSVALYRGAGAIVSLSPARLLDSRVPGATVDGQSAGIGVRGAGSVTEVQVTGRGSVPAGAAAVVLNVTVVQARAGGYATVFPCGEGVPNASNLNFVAGQTVPNAVVAKVGVGGKVCVFAEVPIDLLVDVNGYVPAGSSVGSLSPARLLDSRVPGATVDGQSAGIGVRGAGSVTEVQVTGRGSVPAGAAAVVLNVTVVQARAGGYATVFPCGEGVPNASNLNFVAGQTVPNAVVAKVGVGGKVCVFAEVPIDLLVDVNGYVPAGSSVGSLSPARLLDSRVPGATVDGQSAGIGVRGAGSVTEVQVTGRGSVPAGAAAVVLNVTVVQARAGGYATVFPCGEGVPNASNLNFVAGQTVPNAVVAKVGVGGKVCVFAEVPIDLLVDVNGYVTA